MIGSFWVAITRYRLYEIDAIISKSVTYLGLAVVIVGLYAAVVVVPLLIIGVPDEGGPGLALPIVASAMVAVLFEPIRSRLQRVANRLVYGDRVSPYEVLSQVTSSLPDAAAGDGIGDLAELLARGTGAERSVVWLASGELLQASGVFPDTGESIVGSVAVDGLVDDEFTESRRVLHRGELFGALTIVKPHNDPITPDDRELLSDVAAGSGLLLRNIGLNSQLEQRAADVRASRRRLIAAQDAERHRLERDLHDGAQQQVVALKVKLGIARTIAEREEADEIVARVDVVGRGDPAGRRCAPRGRSRDLPAAARVRGAGVGAAGGRTNLADRPGSLRRRVGEVRPCGRGDRLLLRPGNRRAGPDVGSVGRYVWRSRPRAPISW